MKTWPERVKRYPWSILLLCYLLIIIISSSQAQGLNDLFLPAIFSPPPVLLPNGDFESDPIEWVLDPDGEQLIFSQTELPEGIIPHSGSHAAWLGDHEDLNPSHANQISQTLIVPGSTPILRFWRIFDSCEPDCTTTKDWFIVCIQRTGDQNCEPVLRRRLCSEWNPFDWFQEIIDLQNFAGQSVTLRIQVTTNNLLPLPYTSEIYLDDFTFSNH